MFGCSQMGKNLKSSSYTLYLSLTSADYNASKAASASLHESLRYELDKRYHAPKVRTTLVLPGRLATPMFSQMNASKSNFHKFFTPMVHPISVVKAIITALDEQHSVDIYMPFYAHFVPYVRLLPSFGRDFFQWVSLTTPRYPVSLVLEMKIDKFTAACSS